MNNNKFYSNIALHNMLTRLINSESLCHAYLFYGKKGIGKKTLCRYIAQGVLCKGEQKPCFSCTSCHKLENDNHPDLYTVHSKDSKNSIHIDEIREIRQDAYVKPNESDRKVFVIPNVENMSIGAFNALLKVLEEPPESALFLLTAESKASVPPTILSRCIPYALYPLTDAECKEALDNIHPDIADEQKVDAVARANGILGRALDILSDEDSSKLESISTSIIDGIIAIDEYAVLKAFTEIKSDRVLFNLVIDELLLTFRAGIMVKHMAKQYYNEKQKALAFSLTDQKSSLILDVLQKAVDMNNGNASVTLLTNWTASNLINTIQ